VINIEIPLYLSISGAQHGNIDDNQGGQMLKPRKQKKAAFRAIKSSQQRSSPFLLKKNDPMKHYWKKSVSFHFKDVTFLLE
jgi:hypothetical protein